MGGPWRQTASISLMTVGFAFFLGAAPALADDDLAAAGKAGMVYVVQGLPGQSPDVYVDGVKVTSGAAVKSVVGPLSLAAGKHAVVLRNGPALLAQASFAIEPGKSLDLVAHLQADAKADAVVTAFPNDTAGVAPGKGRLVLSNAAAVPPVDFVVDGRTLVRNVANGESYSALVPGRVFAVSAVPSVTGGAAVVGPLDVPVQAGTLTRVFVIGDISATVAAVVQSVPVAVTGAAAPSSVQTGDGGQAASSLLDDPASLGALGGGAVAVALVATLIFGRSSRRTVPARSGR